MLVVGLGNPGDSYRSTRHNAGFRSVDRLVEASGGSWSHDKKLSVEIASVQIRSSDTKGTVKSLGVKVIKPLLYMNKSGGPVQSVLRYYREFFADSFSKSGLKEEGYSGLPLVVVYDELDFDPGVVRIKTGGSAGGHNGVSDIIQHVSSKDFVRVRIGVGHPRRAQMREGSDEGRSVVSHISVADWVLSTPKGQEFEKIEDGVETAATVVSQLVTRGIGSVRGGNSSR